VSGYLCRYPAPPRVTGLRSHCVVVRIMPFGPICHPRARSRPLGVWVQWCCSLCVPQLEQALQEDPPAPEQRQRQDVEHWLHQIQREADDKVGSRNGPCEDCESWVSACSWGLGM
jgi:hypothetical protein